MKQSNLWQKETAKLRTILSNLKLEEQTKWGLPCFCFNEANIAIIQPFKACLGLMFFKGTLLTDKQELLIANGPNSQASKRMEFTSVAEISKSAPVIKKFVAEAILIEKKGLKINFKKTPQALPPELTVEFKLQPDFKKAFTALTPGRQRAYILFFASAKQTKTRSARIEKHRARILAGKGLQD